MAENNENIVRAHTKINIPDNVLLVMNGGGSLTRGNVTMWKVPPLLRQDKNNQQEYDPLVVSIGPYHHGKKELQPAERFKISSFRLLAGGHRVAAKRFYTKVLDVVNDLRNCYIDGSTDQYDDPYFAQMMLLDACFLMYYFLDGTHGLESCGLNELSSAYIQRDLLLLENQIPFWLIKMLNLLVYGETPEEKYMLKRMLINGREEPIHILDKAWFEYSSHQSGKIITSVYQSHHMINPPDKQPSELGKMSEQQGDEEKENSTDKEEKENSADDSIYSFRSASELKARGIYFKASSEKDLLTSFKFNPGKLFSTLEVPVCHITMYTKSFFLNMIAYEHSGSNKVCNHKVTAYIEFMKLLIENPKDVKELREKEILKVTTLGSDEDVVKVFKDLNTYGLDLDKVGKFDEVKKNIQAHYNKKVKMWIGELLYTYFRSPWTAITLLAATILLLLTFIQTYFTINPWNG